MQYFKPIKTHCEAYYDKVRDIINDDDEYPHKVWCYVNFKKKFNKHQRDEAFRWALGEAGVYTNYLKALAIKLDTHIKPLVGGEFQRCEDGYWRIHVHSILRGKKRMLYNVMHKLWRYGEYGHHDHEAYKPAMGGVAYILRGHMVVPWQHYACPHSRQTCRGAKGCLYSRRGVADLLPQLPRETGRYRYGDAKAQANSQIPPCRNTTYIRRRRTR